MLQRSRLDGLAARIRSLRRRAALVALLIAGPAFADAETPALPAPAWTDAQLEADWLLQARLSPENLAALARQDAAGVNDGVKSGNPEHQTAPEYWAWWEVDLGAAVALDRIEVFNPAANGNGKTGFKVLITTDGAVFTEIPCAEERPVGGNRRWVAKANGRSARHVRVSAGGRGRFRLSENDPGPPSIWFSASLGRDRLRLSEVEVYGAGAPSVNIALHQPANQSSFAVRRPAPAPAAAVEPGASSAPSPPPAAPAERDYPLVYLPVAETVARGRALASALERQGADVEPARAALDGIARRWAALPKGTAVAERIPIYMEARRAVRALAFANPLLDRCERLVFLKRKPNQSASMHQQFHGWYAVPGGGIYSLDGLRSGKPAVRCLTADFPPGNFQSLELSYDASRILFAYARYFPEVARGTKTDKDSLPEDSFYHLYEMALETGAVRQITRGRYDDLHGSYLPGGDIVFMSTRRGAFLQTGAASAQATLARTFPDSFIRCGGEAVRTQTLHRMAPDGSGLRTLSPHETPEWYTAIDSEGRVLYSRWDYVDRDARIAMGLWASNPDGTNPSIVFGNHTTSPFCAFEARAIPGSRRLVFTGSAHHTHTGGPLLRLDPAWGVDGPGPLTNLTPEVCCPEIDGRPLTYYQAPWPLSEEFYLCAWSAMALPIHGIPSPNDLGLYLYDVFGNRELIHRDPAITSTAPIPRAPRPAPPQPPETQPSPDAGHAGRFFVTDVYEGLSGVPRGAVSRLRIVAVPPKVQPNHCVPPLGPTSHDAGKFVLGTVPVERDGSAHFVAPAGVLLWFQVLGDDGRAIQTMRSGTYLQDGQVLSCTGCHEGRNQAPPARDWPLAARRPPSRIRPDVEGSWPLRFDRLLKPMLDRLAADADPKIADLKLDPAKAWALVDGRGTASYPVSPCPSPVPSAWKTLVDYGGEKSLRALIRKQDIDARSFPGQCPSTLAPLWDFFTAGKGAPLTTDERARLALWMDTYAQIQGHFSDPQEAEIAALRQTWASFLEPAPATQP